MRLARCLAVLTTWLIAAACTGSSPRSVTETPFESTPNATPAPTDDPESTSSPEAFELIGTFIAEALSGDMQRIRSVLSLQPRACQPEVGGIGNGPTCPSGVAVGSLLPSLGLSGCGGEWVAGERLDEVLRQWLTGRTQLQAFGAYLDRSGQVIAVLTNDHRTDAVAMLFFTADGLTGLGSPCGRVMTGESLPDGASWILGGG